MVRAGLLAVPVAGVDAASGGETATRAAPPVVRDSAGVTIVENSTPEWGDQPAWRLSDAPFVSIGEIDGAQDYTFHEVMGAATG